MDEVIPISMAYIETIAPNAKALESAKGLMGSYGDMRKDAAGTRLYALFSGTAQAPYKVTVELASPGRYACTCPSRLLPCKHVLGLLMYYESSPGAFAVSDLKEIFPSPVVSAGPKARSSRAASEKSVQKKNILRMRGLRAAGELCGELIATGLGNTPALPAYLDKSSVLLTYKLPEAYFRWCAVIHTLMGSDSGRYQKAFDMLSRYQGMINRCYDYCAARVSDASYPFDSRLESWMGESWTLSKLEAAGRVTENARLIQLSFGIRENNPAKRLEESGVWMELGTGSLVRTMNMRPFSALSSTRESDSFCDIMLVPKLMHYPLGERVRWKDYKCAAALESDFAALERHSCEGGDRLHKLVKKRLMDPLEDLPPLALVRFTRIMSGPRGLYVVDGSESVIELESCSACGIMEGSLPLERYSLILLSFTANEGRITAAPLCLAGMRGIFRFDS